MHTDINSQAGHRQIPIVLFLLLRKCARLTDIRRFLRHSVRQQSNDSVKVVSGRKKHALVVQQAQRPSCIEHALHIGSLDVKVKTARAFDDIAKKKTLHTS